jgi:MFS family permease
MAAITARVVQGTAAAAMAPQVPATFRAVFAGSERGKAFGIYGAMLGFASAVGLLLGGVLTNANLFGWSWRSVFFVNVPVAACALIAGLRFVPETKDLGARRPDLPGAVLLAGSLVAIVYPLLEGRQLGWPAWVWLVLVAGLAGLAVLGLLDRGAAGRAPGRCRKAYRAAAAGRAVPGPGAVDAAAAHGGRRGGADRVLSPEHGNHGPFGKRISMIPNGPWCYGPGRQDCSPGWRACRRLR